MDFIVSTDMCMGPKGLQILIILVFAGQITKKIALMFSDFVKVILVENWVSNFVVCLI